MKTDTANTPAALPAPTGPVTEDRRQKKHAAVERWRRRSPVSRPQPSTAWFR